MALAGVAAVITKCPFPHPSDGRPVGMEDQAQALASQDGVPILSPLAKVWPLGLFPILGGY